MIVFPQIRTRAGAGGGSIAVSALVQSSPPRLSSGSPSFSTSVTATAGRRLLVVAATFNSENSIASGMDIAGGGLSWTRAAQRGYAYFGVYYSSLDVWVSSATAGGSVTITVSSSQTIGWQPSTHMIHVAELENAGAPVQSVGADMSGTGVQTLTLASAPASGSLLVGARYYIPNDTEQNAAVPGAGWSEIYDTHSSVTGWGSLQSQHLVGPTGSDIVWADTFEGAGATAYGMLVGAEIGAA